MTPAEPPAQLFTPGTIFQDRYEIVSEIGVGSYGRVYRARQISTGQDVALKILRLREGDDAAQLETQRQRFLRELRLCARLSHPHIVRLLDCGEYDNGLLYAVFEHVAGSTLRQLLDHEGKLDPIEALHLMTQVLDALACAHREGIVHRDVKPENVMVTHSGLRRNATVLDFGLGGFAHDAGEGSARLTGSREFMGTPAYAAPEQLRGEPLSPRSDLYSWGLILLECLTGEPAIAARTAHDAIVKQLGPDPVMIPGWLRDQRLGRLLVAVTAKDVAARDISEQALLKALESIQRDAGPSRDGMAHRLPTAEGERRQVTVLACTTTVTRPGGGPVELEDLDHAMQMQQALYDDLVRQSGHTLVPGKIGEVHIVFGYPKAHEDDARRAVRMALHLVATSKASSQRLQHERNLAIAVRIGLHSGIGILRVRRRGGAADTGVEVVGAPVVLAAQLADRAEAGEILATAETRALLRDEIECALTGEAIVPDRAAATAVFRVVSERVSSAFESSIRGDETPLVGRAGELGQLTSLWQRAESGGLAIVLLQGEAGIGKSRLVRELRRRVPPESFVACRCVEEGRDTPLHPILTWLRHLPVGLEQLLADHGLDVPATWPILAELLQASRGAYEPSHLSPERQKELALQTVATLVLRMAERRPLLVTIEDVHWQDPTTADFITRLLDDARAADQPGSANPPRLMLLFSARPEYAAPWTGGDAAVMPLGRLSRTEVAAILDSNRAPQEPLSAEVLDRIVERTDGVPLFVEELAHALTHGAEHEIPETLRELLTTRLDGLSMSAYETAQVAAAVGREVSYRVLRAATTRDEWVLRQDLMELVDARLLLARRGSGEEAYVFRHALMRDAAYASMVRATRQRVHRAIAEGMRMHASAAGDVQPEWLAHHLEEAGDLPAAAEHWFRGGDRAFRRAAYTEATRHFERSLAVLARLPETPERITQEIETLTMLGTVHLYTTGHSHPRGREVFARAQTLCEAHSLDLSLKILSHLSGAYMIQGNRDAMNVLRPRLERLLDSPDPVAQLTAVSSLGLDAFWRGEHARAHAIFERGLPLYETEGFRHFAEEYGWDGGIYVPLYATWNAAVLGMPADADGPLLAAAARSFDAQAPALISIFAMAAAHVRHDVVTALAHAEHAIAVSQEQRFLGLLILGMCGRGLALATEGRHAEGIAELQNALGMLEAGGAMSPAAYYGTYLAEACLIAGRVQEGLDATALGLARCETSLARVHEPELLRLEGELHRRAGNEHDAETRFQRALGLAQERGARAWALRAAISLGRLLVDQQRRAEAHAVLAPVSDAFAPASAFPELRDARALLSSL